MSLSNLVAATQVFTNVQKLLDSLREQVRGSKDTSLKVAVSALFDEVISLKSILMRLESENSDLRKQLEQWETPNAERCPKCKKPSWQIESSERDAMFGELGGVRRFYRCTNCDFSESRLIVGRK